VAVAAVAVVVVVVVAVAVVAAATWHAGCHRWQVAAPRAWTQLQRRH
jgi:hypothetical protein